MLAISFTKLDELSALLAEEEKLARNTLECLHQTIAQNQELMLYDSSLLEQQERFWQEELRNIQCRLSWIESVSENLSKMRQLVSRDVASAEDAIRHLI